MVMKALAFLIIDLDEVKDGLQLFIDARTPNSLFDGEESVSEFNESRYQLVEGCYYDYQTSDPRYILGDIGENIIQRHSRTSNVGTIVPNIFVGSLSIPIIDRESSEECYRFKLEVQSVKAGYRDDYRDMLELITEKCTDLLMQVSSPVSQYFEIDYTKDSQTLYQRFAFIKSMIGSIEFSEAVHQIVTKPVTKWIETVEELDVRNSRSLSNGNIKQILKSGKRIGLPESHYLRGFGINTLPERISINRKSDSVDTPENRFIKHALEVFLQFCSDINSKAKEFGHLSMVAESELLIRQLENHLHHTVFNDISRPETLRLNSPVLQRKEGYREVLRIWLMFDLAAKLIWTGGDDIYRKKKKDVATLYEYWLFFKLLDLLQSIFDIDRDDISNLIEKTQDGLSIQVKQGKFTALKGTYNSETRKLNVRFNYNRSFTGRKSYPDPGSWTTTLRPDYTLSIWPFGISELEAETQELIVHVHFDAKYKIANFTDILRQESDNELDKDKLDNRKGIYKNADLLKMHAYKDAIRRTGGAYILYPGDKSINQRGFHEIIPGLGAFPVRPSKTDSGISELKSFIFEVVNHFINRTSQRERIGYQTFEVYRHPPESDSEVRELLPEPYNENRDLIPDVSFVLVGYYKSVEHLDWIARSGLYNLRVGSGTGSLILDSEVVNSRYLLLHTKGDIDSAILWKIVSRGPKVFTKGDLIKLGYPMPSQDFYLVIELEPVSAPEFRNVRWDFRRLKNYSGKRESALPFTASLSELMKNKVTI